MAAVWQLRRHGLSLVPGGKTLVGLLVKVVPQGSCVWAHSVSDVLGLKSASSIIVRGPIRTETAIKLEH